ncbi:uncharacterized protein [Elaeis guineensis]|uniref:uncharacterized protein n=1 Tax=Elaeis guineensis var. tenera TaxID=51953 RepID=UPI003C6D6318
MVPRLKCRTRASSKLPHRQPNSTAPNEPQSQPNSTAPNEPSVILPQQSSSNSPDIEYVDPPSRPNSTAPNEPSAILNVSNSAQDSTSRRKGRGPTCSLLSKMKKALEQIGDSEFKRRREVSKCVLRRMQAHGKDARSTLRKHYLKFSSDAEAR